MNRKERIDWLLTNWQRFNLDGFPWGQPDLWEERHERYVGKVKEIKDAMYAEGVVSPKTYRHDINLSTLIKDARKQRRNGAEVNNQNL